DSISPIFDKEKEQRRLQTVGLISDIGSQVADIARTQGELNALKAAKEAIDETLPANATEKQRQEYLAKLRDTQAYRDEMAKYGTGSEIQRGIQAATAALQGLAGGNLAGALAGASAPELANFIGHNAGINDNDAAKAIAHAILGGVTAALQGNNVAAGAAGAATGELAARAIAGILYPGVKQSDLSEEQKQTISTLATVSAGLAGGLTGNSTASAAVGAQSGKNAVENNFLTADQIDSFAAKAKGCEVRGDCKQIVKEMEELSLKQQQEMIAVCATNPAACKEKFGDIPAKGMLVREAIDRVLGTDVPSAMKNDMSSLLAQQIEAEGVVTSTEFASQLQNRYGIDKQQAEILAVAALGAVTGGMGKSGTSTVTKNIVVVNSGKKGAWNQAMNKPEPNTIYKVDGNKTFQTDALGRTSSVEGILVASKSDRNTYQQCKAGKCGSSGDEGGHLIASIFNGPGEKLNLVPMDGNLNKGVWKQMENTWANALKDGKQVNVKIEPVYTGENKRPDSFSVTYSIDGGRPVIKDISNAPGGVK
uniref:DNA/RNA non-specific endonuclease n=1 Tax=Escherichia coli TaxID=562 RepID=UPI0030F40E3C